MEKTFSTKEIDTLIEALDAWEQKDFAGRMFGKFVSAMVAKDISPEQQQELEREEQRAEEKADREARQRREVATLLKAKLIMMKQDSEIKHLVDK